MTTDLDRTNNGFAFMQRYYRSEAFVAFKNRYAGPAARAYARKCVRLARAYRIGMVGTKQPL